MLYKMLRAINDWFAIAVLWAYIFAFFIAFCLMFVFPFGTLMLLFCGLAGLAIAALLAMLLRGAQQWLARHAVGVGICPRCRWLDHHASDDAGQWRCSHCGAAFLLSGAEVVEQ